MRTRLMLLAALSTACASAPEPIYVLRATETPLRYTAEMESHTVVELPGGGEQKVDARTSFALTLAYGSPAPDGVPFEVVFESFQVEGQAPDLSAMTGQPFRGIVDRGGEARITEGPDLKIPGFDQEGVVQFFSPLAIPLPPEGAVTEGAWPIERERAVGNGMEGNATFSGEARFRPDSEWGNAVKVIESTGKLRQRASGTPPGAPTEVDLEAEGESAATYVWDPLRGVVRHVTVEAELEGTVSTQGLVLPLTVTTRQVFDLAE